MKKALLFIGTALFIFGIVVIAMKTVLVRTKIPSNAIIWIQFERNGQLEKHLLKQNEAKLIIDILDNHIEYYENYSCGFSSSLAVIVDDKSFFIASDGCPFLLDFSTNRFITISKAEKKAMAKLFAEYGSIVFFE